MAQGGKKVQKKERKTRHVAANPKKGQRTIAPKKSSLIKHAAQRKRLTAGINKSIESQMVSAASSGKLTIMKNTMPGGPKARPRRHIKPDMNV